MRLDYVMKISYVSLGLAGVVLAMSGRYYFVSIENAKLRTEAYEFQQVVESLQPQLVAKRQQLQSQQEKLNKGSAISQNVGPAVLADIRLTAEKNNNGKLRDLLQKHGVQEIGAVKAAPSPEHAPVKKGGN